MPHLVAGMTRPRPDHAAGAPLSYLRQAHGAYAKISGFVPLPRTPAPASEAPAEGEAEQAGR